MRKYEVIGGFAIRQGKKALLRPFFNPLPTEKRIYTVDNIDNDSQELGKSLLGTAVYSNIIFEEGNYEDLDGNVINYATGGLKIESAIFVVNMQKTIVKTQVLDRAGTVKEHITNGDYSISISGKIVGENGQRPDDFIREMRRLGEVPQSLTVASEFLLLFGVKQIVIENMDISQRQGSRNVLDININAVSDIPLEIELLNNL